MMINPASCDFTQLFDRSKIKMHQDYFNNTTYFNSRTVRPAVAGFYMLNVWTTEKSFS